jgi:hypothetical protein
MSIPFDLEIGDIQLDPLPDGEPAAPANRSMARMLHALIDAAEFFDSDIAEIISRADGDVLVVACCAKGPDAEDLERWLKGRRLRRERAIRKAEKVLDKAGVR